MYLAVTWGHEAMLYPNITVQCTYKNLYKKVIKGYQGIQLSYENNIAITLNLTGRYVSIYGRRNFKTSPNKTVWQSNWTPHTTRLISFLLRRTVLIYINLPIVILGTTSISQRQMRSHKLIQKGNFVIRRNRPYRKRVK